jgi:cellulose synthase/poly-beta-1,6-N-acetylglucosamine synthase-like glycosyltransferase
MAGLNSMLLSIKVRLFQFRGSVMVSLTAVIPVASTIANLSNLDRNISKALASEIQVVLIIDQVSKASNPQLERIYEKYVQESKAFRFRREKFESPGKARNEGFRFVETEFVTFWDADDFVNVK